MSVSWRNRSAELTAELLDLGDEGRRRKVWRVRPGVGDGWAATRPGRGFPGGHAAMRQSWSPPDRRNVRTARVFRSLFRQRARVGPMLPGGIPNVLLISS